MMKIVIIGSGVMGGGIAELISWCGHDLTLLDIVPKNSIDRNILSKNALSKMNNGNLERISIGNLEDDEIVLKSADWIIEVIIENLDIKKELYSKLERICKSSCIISSNTSTIPLTKLIEGRSENFQENFIITHFFNPPRYMSLVELVYGERTSRKNRLLIADFLDKELGKKIVYAKDSPGFIANRLGCYWLFIALAETLKKEKKIEETDSLISNLAGIPKTAIFGLFDLIGIDVMSLIYHSLASALKEKDPFLELHKENNFLQKMLEKGLRGRKSGGGFYRFIDKNKIIKQSLDLATLEYRDSISQAIEYQNFNELMEKDELAWQIMSKTLLYSVSLMGEASNDIYSIDQAMRYGYNWKYGPFELIDLLGVDNFISRLIKENIAINSFLENLKGKSLYKENLYFDGKEYKEVTREEGIIYLNDFSNHRIILENESARIIKIEDDIAILEIRSKMAILNLEIFELIIEFFSNIVEKFKALIIFNEKENFSVGGNLKYMLANSSNEEVIENYLQQGQKAMLAIKYSKVPVISGLRGMALGGGCELLLHSDYIIAHIDAKVGLVESKVGLIPSWGGCKELILRAQNNKEMQNFFDNILNAKIFSSTKDIQNNFNFTNYTSIANRDRILGECISLAKKDLKKAAKNLEFSSKINIFEKEDNSNKYLAEIFKTERKEEIILNKEREIFKNLLLNENTKSLIKKVIES